MAESFRKKIKAGYPLIGMLQTMACPEVSEILALAGFDWVFVDMEHSALDTGKVQQILQACGDRLPAVVRVPSNAEMWAKRLLDMGASGLIFPQVNSAPEAERIARMCKYPPQGNRGIGLGRAQGYGLNFKEYVKSANEQVAVILQIEHLEAVQNIEAIVKVEGIDALFIGPYDLSGSMGKPGLVDDAEVRQQIDYVRFTCRDVGLSLGIFTADPGAVNPLVDQGYSLVALGVDTMFFAKSVQETLQGIKGWGTGK